MTFRALQVGVFVAVAATTACSNPSSQRQTARPKLVVVIVVDQLRADYLERFRGRHEGGLRWLLDNGAYFQEAAYRHAATVTATGHATVSTGRHPSSHGIVGNSWRESDRGPVYCVRDDRYVAVGGPGEGASPLALRTETLGDRLKKASAGSKVYAFSTKDRSAVLLAGLKADGAFWFEPDCGCLITSSYYGARLPDWLAEFNSGPPAAAYAGETWSKLLDDDALYERMARADRFPTESDGADTVFPHALPSVEFEGALAATPFSDRITLDAATAALRSGELGSDDDPDLLALGLSATDSIGHRYGPFSQEAMDNHLRLDRALGEFIQTVEATVGLENTVFALTADHGAVPLVEHLVAQGVAAERFDSEAFWARAELAIEECGAGPASETVAQSNGRQLYWNETALRERGIDRDTAGTCVADWLRGQDAVDTVMTAEQLASGGTTGIASLFENGYYEGRSPHVVLHLREYVHVGGPRGTGHGTAHEYDRDVPVLLAGAGIRPGTYPEPAGPEDIAPTLGVILGLEQPIEPDTRILREALQ